MTSIPMPPEGGFPKSDSGSGKLSDYRYNLVPNNKRVVLRLAGSDAYQDELIAMTQEPNIEGFVAPRTMEEERVDAPMPVRFFTGRRMSGIVGWVPRGLEPAVIEALTRLESAGKPTRLPVEVVRVKGQLRVDILMGQTR
jgi:hypothetical protein